MSTYSLIGRVGRPLNITDTTRLSPTGDPNDLIVPVDRITITEDSPGILADIKVVTFYAICDDSFLSREWSVLEDGQRGQRLGKLPVSMRNIWWQHTAPDTGRRPAWSRP